MRRRRLTILAAASAVLCVATFALWVRGYWRPDVIGRPPLTLRTGPGGLRLSWAEDRNRLMLTFQVRFLGFAYQKAVLYQRSEWDLDVPFWFIAAAWATVAGAALRRS